MIKALGVSERRACRVLGTPRSTQRYEPSLVEDEKALTEEIVELPVSSAGTAIGESPPF